VELTYYPSKRSAGDVAKVHPIGSVVMLSLQEPDNMNGISRIVGGAGLLPEDGKLVWHLVAEHAAV
jgi:hypothetical protein